MIRAKLREKFGKSETEPSSEGGEEQTPTEIPDETPADIQQDDEDETTSVRHRREYLLPNFWQIKCISLIRNMMIERGLEGSFSLTMYRILFTRAWNVDVAEGDEPVELSISFTFSIKQIPSLILRSVIPLICSKRASVKER
jgi:hypothetical protein